MNHERNRELIELFSKELICQAVQIAKDKRIRFTSLHESKQGRRLIKLLGKEKIISAIEIAADERIRFSALLHEIEIMEIEKALAEKKSPMPLRKNCKRASATYAGTVMKNNWTFCPALSKP